VGETRVRQSDKLIILIVQQGAFRLKDGPGGGGGGFRVEAHRK
jgi:hypothetical protein